MKSSLFFIEGNPSAVTDVTDCNILTVSFSRHRLQYSYLIIQLTQTAIFLPYPPADTDCNILTVTLSRHRMKYSYHTLQQTQTAVFLPYHSADTDCNILTYHSADTDCSILTLSFSRNRLQYSYVSFSRHRLQYSYRIIQQTQTPIFLPYLSADTDCNILTLPFSRHRLQYSYHILQQTQTAIFLPYYPADTDCKISTTSFMHLKCFASCLIIISIITYNQLPNIIHWIYDVVLSTQLKSILVTVGLRFGKVMLLLATVHTWAVFLMFYCF